MTTYRAIELALKIVNTCKKNEDRCTECPFNIGGCIVSEGSTIPMEWEVKEIIKNGIKAVKGE